MQYYITSQPNAAADWVASLTTILKLKSLIAGKNIGRPARSFYRPLTKTLKPNTGRVP